MGAMQSQNHALKKELLLNQRKKQMLEARYAATQSYSGSETLRAAHALEAKLRGGGHEWIYSLSDICLRWTRMKLSPWWQILGVSTSKCVFSVACLQASELIFSGNGIRGLFLRMYVILLMMMSWCLMSSDVIWHIRDKLWPMPKHGSIKATYVRCMCV